MCSSLVHKCSTCLLLCSPPEVSHSPNPSLLVLLGSSLCFLCIFSSLLRARNDKSGSLYRKYDLGLLRVQNRLNFTKTRYPTSRPQLPSAVALSYWIIGWVRLVRQRQLAAFNFLVFVVLALTHFEIVSIAISSLYTCKT